VLWANVGRPAKSKLEFITIIVLIAVEFVVKHWHHDCCRPTLIEQILFLPRGPILGGMSTTSIIKYTTFRFLLVADSQTKSEIGGNFAGTTGCFNLLLLGS
jgi:hypothetical protein